MAADVLSLLTPTVLIAVAISVVAAASLTAIGFLYFLSRTARASIDAAQATGGKVIDAASEAIEQLATNGAEVLKPIGRGVGEVLGAVADRIKLKQSELNDLAREKVLMVQELERLRTRHINASQVSEQLKLALLEITQRYDSFEKWEIEKTDKGLIQAQTSTEYLGVRRATFKTQIGVDLKHLRFGIGAEGTIGVHGLKDVRVIGISNLEIQSLLAEIRLNKLNGDKVLETNVLLDHRGLTEHSDEHQRQLIAAVQAPQSVEHWAAATAKFALGFLQACLNVTGFQLVETERPLENGMDFMELCRMLNAQTATRMEAISAQQQLSDQKSLALQAEVLQLIEDAGTGTELKPC